MNYIRRRSIAALLAFLVAFCGSLQADESRAAKIEQVFSRQMLLFKSFSVNSSSTGDDLDQLAAIRQEVKGIAAGDSGILAAGIVRFITTRAYIENVHPMVSNVFLLNPYERWQIKERDLVNALISYAPYDDGATNDRARMYAQALLYSDLDRDNRDQGFERIRPFLHQWGLNDTDESAFLVELIYDVPVFNDVEHTLMLTEHTDTTRELLEIVNAVNVESFMNLKMEQSINTLLCSDLVWARLCALRYLQKHGNVDGKHVNEDCLASEAAHPLEARWAAELKAKLAAEKENADADAGTAEAD